ncbi:MAG TPA: hypothetical protein EYF95_02290 [Flavobacteriales bacterium]|nr:hypothetical protein [Flavobacteriales bacterium]
MPSRPAGPHMKTTIMVTNEDNEWLAPHDWLAHILFPDKFPPDAKDAKLMPFTTTQNYGQVSGSDLVYHTDDYDNPTWMAFTSLTRIKKFLKPRAIEQGLVSKDEIVDAFNKSIGPFGSAVVGTVGTEILFWDKADYDNEDSWTSYDNTGEVALERYKKALVIKIFHESINVVKISKV